MNATGRAAIEQAQIDLAEKNEHDEVARLRAALQKIAADSLNATSARRMQNIARAALEF